MTVIVINLQDFLISDTFFLMFRIISTVPVFNHVMVMLQCKWLEGRSWFSTHHF